METIEVSGKWWASDTPDRRVSGTLAVDKRGRAQLKLIGALRPWTALGEVIGEGGTTTTVISEGSLASAGVYPRILGIAEGKYYTLEDCFETSSRRNLFGEDEGGTQTVRVNQVFQGVHFEPDEPLEFTSLVVRMDWLRYWVARGGIAETVAFNKSDDSRIGPREHTLTVRPVQGLECDGLGGGVVKLGQIYGVGGDGVAERRVWQDFYFAIEAPVLVPLTDLLGQAGILQDLVSIGTGRRAAFTKVTLLRPDIAQQVGGNTTEAPIEMYASWQVTNDAPTKSITRHEMPFTLDMLGEEIQGIASWLAAANAHRSALARVMSTRYSPSQYAVDSFMNCAAAIEGYDRDSHGDNIYYRERLLRAARHAGSVFLDLIGDVDSWSTAMKELRNDVAHHNPGVGSGSTGQVILGKSAYWCLVMCLLRDSGAPEGVFDNIRAQSEFRWLRATISEWLSTRTP